MVATIFIFLVATAFGIVGAYVGYTCGFDKGWDTALECLEEEVKNGIQSKN